MSFWWLQPGWTSAQCACGAAIYPEGDPDWGACYSCFSAQFEEREQYRDKSGCQHCDGYCHGGCQEGPSA